MVNVDEAQKQLFKKMSFFPSREWINTYFDLVKRALDVTGLDIDDPRLSMSLSPQKTGWQFPMTINFRYVIAAQKKRVNGQDQYSVGLIFTSYCRYIPELSQDRHIDEPWKFRNLPGEFSEPPCFLRFNDLYAAARLISSLDPVKQCWQEALMAEVNRANASPFRRFHRPNVYKLVKDLNIRASTLDMLYPESRPVLGL